MRIHIEDHNDDRFDSITKRWEARVSISIDDEEDIKGLVKAVDEYKEIRRKDNKKRKTKLYFNLRFENIIRNDRCFLSIKHDDIEREIAIQYIMRKMPGLLDKLDRFLYH